MNEQEQHEFDRLYNAHFFGQHVDGMRLAHCEYFFEQGLRSGRDAERRQNAETRRYMAEQRAETQPDKRFRR